MARKLENEVALLDQYNEQLRKLIVQLSEADPQSGKKIQKEIDQRLEIYSKQFHLVQTEFPDSDVWQLHEAAFYTFQAGKKVFGSGFLRRVASKSGQNVAIGLASATIAHQQEKHAAREALTLLDKALSIFDYPGARFQKAQIYAALKQKEQALAELKYIIANFEDDDVYIEARQMKDELETPPKKGMCFVATAVYGSPLVEEVVTLSRFRDEVLLKSNIGSLFVTCYYRISPPLAAIIASNRFLRSVTRGLFLAPILRLLRVLRHS